MIVYELRQYPLFLRSGPIFVSYEFVTPFFIVEFEAYMICSFFDNLPVIDDVDVIGLVKYVESMCHQNPRAMSQGPLKYTVFEYPRSNMSINSGERIVE